MIVVSNSSPLISLARARKLYLLQDLFGEVHIPDAVYHEVVTEGRMRPGAADIVVASDWVVRKAVEDQASLRDLRGAFRRLGPGETEVILLAQQLSADWAIIDELLGRKVASQRGVKVIGTIGILLLAKQQKLINNVREVLDLLVAGGFRISKTTYDSTLVKAGEILH